MKSRMTSKRVFFILFAILFLISAESSKLLGTGNLQQRTIKQRPIPFFNPGFKNISPQKVVLTKGGSSVIVKFEGGNLSMIASAQVTRGGNEAPGIDETLNKTQLPAILIISLKASSNAATAKDYQLTVFDSRRRGFTIPDTALSIEAITAVLKTAPAPTKATAMKLNTKMAVRQPEKLGIPPSTPPYISSWTKSPGYANGEIKFLGRDIVTDYFVAKIGSTALNIISRSSTEVRAKLPSSRMAGDMEVSYGTTGSRYVLERGYRVIGDPVISSVSPASFTKGEQVRLGGLDLELVFPLAPAAGGKFLKISDTSSSSQGTDFLEVISFQVASDGKSATFNAGEAFAINMSAINVAQQRQHITPQPTQLRGKLRFAKGGSGSWECTVTSPSSVTYKGISELRVDKIWGSYWGENSDFVILTSDYTKNSVRVRGIGLYPGTTAKIGETNIHFNLDYQGTSGWADMPINAQTNPIIFSRDGLTASSPVIKVIPGPQFMPDTMTFLGSSESYVVPIVLNTTYRLQGWYLQPSGVSGLTYSLLLGGISEGMNALLVCKVISHTANVIEFRVEPKVPVSNWPAGWDSSDIFGGNPTHHMNLYFEGKYGTIRYYLLERFYKIVVP